MRRQPETAGAAFVCLGGILAGPRRALLNLAVHRGEPIGSQMAEIGVAGTGSQSFTSAGVVAHQLHSIRASGTPQRSRRRVRR